MSRPTFTATLLAGLAAGSGCEVIESPSATAQTIPMDETFIAGASIDAVPMAAWEQAGALPDEPGISDPRRIAIDQALGIEGAQDLPIIGWEVYTVAGTGVRLVSNPSE